MRYIGCLNLSGFTWFYLLLLFCRDGANVKGVFAWSLIDGFEFNLGMGVRVGIYYVDNELKRHPRKSAQWFKAMLANTTSAAATRKKNLYV